MCGQRDCSEGPHLDHNDADIDQVEHPEIAFVVRQHQHKPAAGERSACRRLQPVLGQGTSSRLLASSRYFDTEACQPPGMYHSDCYAGGEH